MRHRWPLRCDATPTLTPTVPSGWAAPPSRRSSRSSIQAVKPCHCYPVPRITIPPTFPLCHCLTTVANPVREALSPSRTRDTGYGSQARQIWEAGGCSSTMEGRSAPHVELASRLDTALNFDPVGAIAFARNFLSRPRLERWGTWTLIGRLRSSPQLGV